MSKSENTFRLCPYGQNGWMIRWDDSEYFHGILSQLMLHLETEKPFGLMQATPGYQTLHLQLTQDTAESDLIARLNTYSQSLPKNNNASRLHQIKVNYGDPDLDEMAKAKKMSVNEIISRHSAREYIVYFMGFSPGFPYLGPLDETLHYPRRAKPRTRIQPGSVAIGGSHTGIYSVASPGGWHVIGKTDTFLFTSNKASGGSDHYEDAFLLKAGDRIKFIPSKDGCT